MSLIEQIPLTGLHKDVYKDVMDYMENIKKRKAGSAAEAAKLAENQRQFGISNELEHEKLGELSKYHQGNLALKQKLAEMKAAELTGGKKLSAQERNEAMKLRTTIRKLNDLDSIAAQMEGMLNKNDNLTGIIPGALTWANHPGEELGEYNALAGLLQTGSAGLASYRPGMQVIKFMENIKPGSWKDTKTNKGYLTGIRSAHKQDVASAIADLEDLTGLPYQPHSHSEQSNGNITKWKMVDGKLVKG